MTALRIKNPVILKALTIVSARLRGELAGYALAGLLLPAKSDTPTLVAAKAQCEEIARQLLLVHQRTTEESELPALALRLFVWGGEHADYAKFGVLFPAKVGNPDLRAIWESWGFSWLGEAGPKPYGCPQNGAWRADPVHLYRNARHALISLTYYRLIP